MVSNTLFTSNTEERYTPKDFFEEIDKEFHFTLDPCATKENHKCEKFYTKEEDGLKQNRDNEIVFCNPPYGKEIKKRVEKGSLARGGMLLCFYLQEQTPNDFTTLFIEKQKSDLSKVVGNSDEQKILHRSQVCLQYLEILQNKNQTFILFIEMIEIKDRDKYCNQFIDTFHFQLNGCAEVYQRFIGEPKVFIGLNIFKFEEKMREKGYKDGSLKDFVESKYGKEASVLIDKLL